MQEVIFEVKWDLSFDSATQEFYDSGYDFALGKFEGMVSEDFPYYNPKYPAGVPVSFFNHKVMHQFWKARSEWPVVQFGPGIMTVNDTDKNYEWEETFFPLIQTSLDRLMKSYEALSFTEYSLRYIDVVKPKDYHPKDWPSFIHNNLNFEFENNFNTRGELKDFQFQQSFKVNELGDLVINLSNGINNKKEDIFVWQTTLIKKDPSDLEGLLRWLNQAHRCTSEVFKEICKEDFYGSFT